MNLRHTKRLALLLLLSLPLPFTSVGAQQVKQLTAWRAERIGTDDTLRLDTSIAEPVRLCIESPRGLSVEVSPLRTVLTDDFRSCGHHPEGLPAYGVYDVIDSGTTLNPADGSCQPVWVSVEVGTKARARTYSLRLRAVGVNSGRTYNSRTYRLRVVDHTLPPAHDYQFHLDFWQQPYSVSRYYGVERWSDEHLRLLRPYMQQLARAGQKVVTAILFYEPWGDQSYDKFSPMVETIRQSDGQWRYDYSVFDRWVEFMQECGIDRQIDCYSMIPWDMQFRYFDEATQQTRTLATTTSSPEYRDLWTAFLTSFAQHLRERGWLEKTCIAMDERSMPDMMRAYDIVRQAEPELKLSLAGNKHAELIPLLQDYSVAYGQTFSTEELAQRRQQGQTTTLYTCCTEEHPNLFTNSPSVEATFLPLYCIAQGFDGYLHWSWLNWPADPLHDSRYRLFSPGDTYIVYPGNRSSVRWERFLEGVQQAEKIFVLRREAPSSADTDSMEQQLRSLGEVDAANTPEITRLIQRLEDTLNR